MKLHLPSTSLSRKPFLFTLIFFLKIATGTIVAQTSLEYQAEDYTACNGVSTATNHAGYTGSGFVDYGENGTWMEWNNVNVGSDGTFTLTFRYANGSSGNRQSAVLVNGTNTGNVAFASTGSWSNWGTVSHTVTLPLAVSAIRVQANTNSGGPNLDKMEVVSEDPPNEDKTFDGTVTIQDADGSGNTTNLEVYGTSNLGPVVLDVAGGGVGSVDSATYTDAPFLLKHDTNEDDITDLNLAFDGDHLSTDAQPFIIQNTNPNGGISFQTGANATDRLTIAADGSVTIQGVTITDNNGSRLLTIPGAINVSSVELPDGTTISSNPDQTLSIIGSDLTISGQGGNTVTLPTAINGVDGQDGTNGAIWMTGNGVPDDATGANNDLYLDTSTGDYYIKAAGSWGTAIGNITGPQGVEGPIGPAGPAGASPFVLNGNHVYFTSGNVGIGTDTPSEVLDVSGDVRVDGTVNVVTPAGDIPTITY